MNDKSIKLSKVLSYAELCMIEAALAKHEPKTEHGEEVLADLRNTVTAARGWAHHLGKAER